MLGMGFLQSFVLVMSIGRVVFVCGSERTFQCPTSVRHQCVKALEDQLCWLLVGGRLMVRA